LGERRSINDQACMEGRISNSNLTVTVWGGDCLVGIARSVTDFHYACYLSDLAVSYDYQHQGIGNSVRRLRLARNA
jgi:ribosomal protein S18 acetylase RimI-like enzyme